MPHNFSKHDTSKWQFAAGPITDSPSWPIFWVLRPTKHELSQWKKLSVGGKTVLALASLLGVIITLYRRIFLPPFFSPSPADVGTELYFDTDVVEQ